MAQPVKKWVAKFTAAKSAMTRNINTLTKMCDEMSILQGNDEICNTTLKRLAENIQAQRETVEQNQRAVVTAGDNLIEVMTEQDAIDEAATEKSIKDVNTDIEKNNKKYDVVNTERGKILNKPHSL